jgi:hypothetical protein
MRENLDFYSKSERCLQKFDIVDSNINEPTLIS